MMAHTQPGPSWQYPTGSFHQYVIKDEPDPFAPLYSQDSGLRSDLDLSWSEENPASLSTDSGFSSSFNMSVNSTLPNDDYQNSVVKEEKEECHSSASRFHTNGDSASHSLNIGQSRGERQPKELTRIEHSDQQFVVVHHGGQSSRPFGFYGQPLLNIQPKPVEMQHQTLRAQTTTTTSTDVSQVAQQFKKRPPNRSRKSQLIPRIDDYQPEDVKPSQELLAARRLLQEALITGNIISQARYARMNKRLDSMRLKMAQRSTVLQSFSQNVVPVEPPVKRVRTEEKAPCSRALYQENKRLDGRKFTWKIGINGPHKSFNRLSVKRSGKRKRRLSNNRSLLGDGSDDSDENTPV